MTKTSLEIFHVSILSAIIYVEKESCNSSVTDCVTEVHRHRNTGPDMYDVDINEAGEYITSHSCL